jgi:hypothetical protein
LGASSSSGCSMPFSTRRPLSVVAARRTHLFVRCTLFRKLLISPHHCSRRILQQSICTNVVLVGEMRSSRSDQSWQYIRRRSVRLADYTGQDLAPQPAVRDTLDFPKTDIARTAVFLIQVLAEISENCAMPAGDSAAIAVHLSQFRSADIVRLRFRLFEDALPCQVVGPRIQDDAFGFQSIPSCAPAFLLVVLERHGHAA